jgi:hypothetical protein
VTPQDLRCWRQQDLLDQGIDLRCFPCAFDLPDPFLDHWVVETLAGPLACGNGAYHIWVACDIGNVEYPIVNKLRSGHTLALRDASEEFAYGLFQGSLGLRSQV